VFRDAQQQSLKNPYAKDFYHRYYTRPQKEQELLIQSLSKRVSDLQNDMKSQYPYRGVDWWGLF